MVMSALLESLARYQDVMKQLQSQAKQLMTVGSTFFSVNFLYLIFISGNKDDTLASPPVSGRVPSSEEEFPGAEAEGGSDFSSITAGGGQDLLPQ